MLVLHHLEYSRSTRIIWLLEELGLPYQLTMYQRHPRTMLAPAELKALPPLGNAPILQVGDLFIGESAVIIEYVLDKYDTSSRLRPPIGAPERLAYNYWLHCAESTLAPLSSISLLFNVATEKTPWLFRPIIKKVRDSVDAQFLSPRRTALLDYIEQTLSRSTWLAGDQITGADIQMGTSFILSNIHKVSDKERPFLNAYLKRIEETPSFIRAIKKGGPLDFSYFLSQISQMPEPREPK